MSEHDQFDPFDLVAALSPVATLDEALPTDDALLQSIMRDEVPQRRSARRGRHLRIIGGTGLCLVLVVAAAFSFTQRRASTLEVASVVCYSEVAETPHVRSVVDVDGDPIEACRRSWERGDLIDAGTVQAPAMLVGCIAPNGLLAVLPGSMASCEQLGYPVWAGNVVGDDLARLETAILRWVEPAFRRGACLTYDEGMALANSVIEHFELRDWTIEVADRWVPNQNHPICTLAVPIRDRKVIHVDFFIDPNLYLPGREP